MPWESLEAIQGWKAHREFKERMSQVQAFVDKFAPTERGRRTRAPGRDADARSRRRLRRHRRRRRAEGLLGDDHEVVLVDRKPEFAMGLRKLWELVGIGTIAEGSRSVVARRARDRVVEEEILSIDPAARAAETTAAGSTATTS